MDKIPLQIPYHTHEQDVPVQVLTNGEEEGTVNMEGDELGLAEFSSAR